MSENEKICPSCGEELIRNEDTFGVTYQCTSLDCMQLFDADEIEAVSDE